jgi:hypothetical protein
MIATALPTVARGLRLAFGACLLVSAGLAHAADDDALSQRYGVTVLRGSGNLATEARTVPPFQAVDLKGSMRLVVRQAAREAVEVRADDNLLPLIDTSVIMRGGVPTLEVGSKKGANYATRNRVVVTVDVVNLKMLKLSGAGDVQAEGLKTADLQLKLTGSGNVQLRQLSADALSVSISGSGDVHAAGRAGKLAVSIAGSGDVEARELEADDVNVRIAGSGDAGVHARKSLVISIAGSGDVDYAGEATVTTSIAGSGSVKKR